MRFYSALIGMLAMICVPISAVQASPTCDLSPEKKRIIETILCGQGAKELVYQKHGRGCVKRSAEVRMRDTAVQIRVMQMCGHYALADQMKVAILKTMEFMEVLSVCTSEKIDLQDIWAEQVRIIREQSYGQSCTQALRNKVSGRLSFFREMVRRINSGDIINEVYRKLGVSVDSIGNVREQ